MAGEDETLMVTVLDENVELSLGELSHTCGVSTALIIALVEEGVIEPRGVEPAAWRFPATAVATLGMAQRLQQDLGINLAGTALALDLLEELRALRVRVRLLERLLEE